MPFLFIKKNKKVLIVIIGTYLIMVLLNFLTPLIADDLEYYYKTESLSTIFRDEYTQYISWTGRSVVHAIARFFLLLPKPVFNFINPLAYVYLTLIIYSISTNCKQFRLLKYTLINFSLWLFIPTYGQVFLWETGSANYLWGSIIILSLVFIYHNFYEKGSSSVFIIKRRIVSPLIFLLGILGGWCNENTSGGLLLLLIVYIIIGKRRQGFIPKWMISGMVGCVVGLFIMISSPGNKIRSAYFERSSWALGKKIFTGVLQITENLQEYALYFILLLAVVIILQSLFPKCKQKLFLSACYVFVGVATIYVLALSPSGLGWGRSYFGGIIYLIIALFISWPDNLAIIKNSLKPFYISLSVMLSINFLFSFVIGTADIALSYRDITNRYEYLEKQKKLGNLNPVMGSIERDNVTFYPAYSKGLSNIGKDPNLQINRATAKYFGLESVTAVTETEWEQRYRYGDPLLMNIQVLDEYLERLNNGEYVVLLVGIGPLEGLSEKNVELLKALYPDYDNSDNSNRTIIGSCSSEGIIYKSNPSFSEFNQEIIGRDFNLEAKFASDGKEKYAHIKIDGVHYSVNAEGLNFVILDPNGKRVLDSVSFNISNNTTKALR